MKKPDLKKRLWMDKVTRLKYRLRIYILRTISQIVSKEHRWMDKIGWRIFLLIVFLAIGIVLAWLFICNYLGSKNMSDFDDRLALTIASSIASIPLLFVLWLIRTYDVRKQITQNDERQKQDEYFKALDMFTDENLNRSRLGINQLNHLYSKGLYTEEIHNVFDGYIAKDKDFSGLDLRIFTFNKTDFQSANLSNADLSNTDLSKAKLTGVNLSEANLLNVELSGLNLTGANLSGVDFSGKSLTKTVLAGANLSGANLSEKVLSDYNLSRANLSGAYLFRANLSKANLYDANFSRSNLSEAELSGANLSVANLSRADLSGANLSGVNLSGADLSVANLSGADLSGANLSGVKLSGSKLSKANLSGVNLSRLNLSGANLSSVDLNNVDLSGSNFTDTNFKDVKNLSSIRSFKDSWYNDKTLETLPLTKDEAKNRGMNYLPSGKTLNWKLNRWVINNP